MNVATFRSNILSHVKTNIGTPNKKVTEEKFYFRLYICVRIKEEKEYIFRRIRDVSRRGPEEVSRYRTVIETPLSSQGGVTENVGVCCGVSPACDRSVREPT